MAILSGCKKEDNPEPAKPEDCIFRVIVANTDVGIANAKILVYASNQTGGSLLFPVYTNYPLDSLLTDSNGYAQISNEVYNSYINMNYERLFVSASPTQFTYNGIKKDLTPGLTTFSIASTGYLRIFLKDQAPLNPQYTDFYFYIDGHWGNWIFPPTSNPATGYLVWKTGFDTMDVMARLNSPNDTIMGNDTTIYFSVYLPGNDTTYYTINY